MSAVFSLRRCADEEGRTAGGKVVRSRRARAADRTPYALPQPPTEEPVPESSGNPNWLSGLIYPARAIASRAGRILSAVFGPDSLSSSSSAGDSCSEDEDDESDAADVDLNEVVSSMNANRETVHLIQQLVMQQTFSREECYELIKLVRSRVVKWDGNLSNTEIISGARNNAVMEARKWLEEQKSRSVSNPKVTSGEKSSPVHLAKSYMEAQPTWSSPVLKHVEFRTPSQVQGSKDNFHSCLQPSEMPESPVSTGSWKVLNPKSSLGLPATNSVRLPESVEMEHERSQGGALQSDNASLVPKQLQDEETNPDVNSDQFNGSRLSHEMDGLRDSGTIDHALSLSLADPTLEPRHNETTDAADSSKEKVDVTVSDNLQLQNEHSNRVPGGSQDSSRMLFEDSLQVAAKSDPDHKQKDAPPRRNLRPRTKR